MTTFTKANLYLLLISFLWGGTFPIIKNAIANIDPYTFVALRFVFASLFFLILILRKIPSGSYKLIISGCVLGLLNAIAYTTQTIGLKYISSSRSAFITGACVVMVPLFAIIFKLEQFSKINIFAAMLCLYGLFILTGSNIAHISYGDILTLICAVAVALQIIFLQYISSHHSDYKLICFYQILFTAPLPAVMALHTGNFAGIFHPTVMFAFFYCVIFATIITLYLQTKYQKFTTATSAALIFSLEPVFASLLGVMINGEVITHSIIIGGAVMMASVILPEFIKAYL